MISVKDKDKPQPPPWKRRLHLPAYSVNESARYSGTTSQTVAYWHYYGGKVGPAITGKEKGKPLSYLQLIEVAFVATMRKYMTLQKIRKAREYASQTFEVEYPFAELRWKTEGRHLLLNLQDFEGDAEVDSLIVADQAGQEAWESAMAERFEQFDYEQGLALVWHVLGKKYPIIIDPRISFGAPIIHGLPTWVVKGRYEAGETIQEIYGDFHLKKEDIVHALKFEGIEPQFAV